MERDPALYPESNHVQWDMDVRFAQPYDDLGRPTTTSATDPAQGLDGFSVTRPGDQNTRLRIMLHLNHYPERVKLTPEFANLLSITEGTKQDIYTAFYNYVKLHGLQDKTDKRLIRLGGDERLKQAAGGYDTLNYKDIPTLLMRYMTVVDPVILPYEVTVSQESVNAEGESPTKAYDLELEMDDMYLRAKMGEVYNHMTPEKSRKVTHLDEEVRLPRIGKQITHPSLVGYKSSTANTYFEGSA